VKFQVAPSLWKQGVWYFGTTGCWCITGFLCCHSYFVLTSLTTQANQWPDLQRHTATSGICAWFCTSVWKCMKLLKNKGFHVSAKIALFEPEDCGWELLVISTAGQMQPSPKKQPRSNVTNLLSKPRSTSCKAISAQVLITGTCANRTCRFWNRKLASRKFHTRGVCCWAVLL